MRIYNSNSLGFKPLRKRAQSPRQIRKANIGEPETRLPPPPEQRLVYLDEELAERERKAQEEIERKKMCTAPAYSKGAYQYIYTAEEAKDAGRKKMKITEFKGAYSFLSNFYLSPITFEYLNEIWHADTVEHAFQAMKSDQKDDVAHVLRSLNAGVAKRRGRKLTLRSDWDKVKDDVMLELLRLKFAIPDLRDKLLATKNATLIEGNTWGDTYWGVCRGIGDNTLGVLLMQVRSEIKRSLQLIN